MHRRKALTLLATVAVASAKADSFVARISEECTDHAGWVVDVLKRINTIRTGMTRADQLKVFTTEGGLSSRRQRTYVSRDCPYFKVDVDFEMPKGTSQAADNAADFEEGASDIIVKLSRPYLQFSVMN